MEIKKRIKIMISIDSRYTIQKEFCGHKEAKHIVRFCGDWVGKADSRVEAIKIASAHREKMLTNINQ
jgi:hypothetical protein